MAKRQSRRGHQLLNLNFIHVLVYRDQVKDRHEAIGLNSVEFTEF